MTPVEALAHDTLTVALQALTQTVALALLALALAVEIALLASIQYHRRTAEAQ